MAVDINSAEGQAIRKFVPLATLSSLHFEAICTELFIEQADKGSVLFRKGQETEHLIYLLEGEINLQAEGLKVESISSGSIAAQFAIAHQSPRQIDAVANSYVQYLSIKNDLLEKPPTVYVEQENNYIVTEDKEEQGDDWMAMLLRAPIFRHLSPQNLQTILLTLDEVSFGKDKVIISQDDQGKYFYLLKRGYCQISRKPSSKAKAIKLSQLRSTDTFGEDSLISEESNHFSVHTLTECSLLRLNKEQFLTLIKEPSLKKIEYTQLKKQQDNNAQIIDVRLPDEYKQKHLEGSINLPYFSLRMQMKNIDRERPVVIVCENGKISEAASFLLFKYNFEPFILEDGIQGIQHDISKPSAQYEIFDGVGVVLNHADNPAEQEKLAEKPERDPFETLEQQLAFSPSNDNLININIEPEPIAELNLDITQIEAFESNLSDKVDDLTEENKRLKQTAQKLHNQCKKLLEDKSKLEKKLIEAVKQKKALQQQLRLHQD